MEILLVCVDAQPSTAKGLGNRARHVTPGEWINHEVAGLGQQVNKEVWQLCREAGWMWLEATLATTTEILLDRYRYSRSRVGLGG